MRDRYHDAILADSLNLPHANHVFDFAICIAVIHHLSSPERRVAAIRAIVATLKQGHPENVAHGDEQGPDAGANSGSNLITPAAAPTAAAAAPASTSTTPPAAAEETLDSKTRALVPRRHRQRTAPGQALLFVWALEQSSSRRGWAAGDEQDVLVPWVLHQTHKPRPASTDADAQQSEGKDGKGDTVFNRYYHLYAAGELQGECEAAGASVVRSGYDRDNWWVVVEPASAST